MPVTFQHRTLTVSCAAIPEISGQPALVPVRMSGVEALNELFSYTLELRTPDSLNFLTANAANFYLKEFVGQQITVQIEVAGGGQNNDLTHDLANDPVMPHRREITALVTEAYWLEMRGRHVRYQLVLQPWLAQADRNSDCRIYQDLNVVEIFDALLKRYPFPVEKRLIERYPVRDYQTQYNESDYHFFCRLCEEWGINWFFEHDDGQQRLILIDSMDAYRSNPAPFYRNLDFNPHGSSVGMEFVERFMPMQAVTAGRYTVRDYDYTQPDADLTATHEAPRETAHNQQEVYAWHVDSHYSQPTAGNIPAGQERTDGSSTRQEAQWLARMRMESLRQCGVGARGSGPLRGMVPGCRLRLWKHPHDAANTDYLITSATLLIEDVDQEAQTSGVNAQHFRVVTDFIAHPLEDMLRPRRHTSKPRSLGPQTAVVVGAPGKSIWTDQYGRIKVQFPWDRIGQRDQNSSCWIRVSSPWAGNQMGGMQLPRIGQEVLVDFIGGDLDLPICIGRVYNQNNLPPWTLPGQSALSGFRTRELADGNGNAAAGRSNHLIFDDTGQQIQVQLKSDCLDSQLSLGHITRIEDQRGRQDARGEGFELRSDGHGVLRAANGMLITTDARSAAAAHITAMDETNGHLRQAAMQHEQSAVAARSHEAQEDGEQRSVADTLHAQNDAIHGTVGADRQVGKFSELSEPHLVFSSPAGIASCTPQSTHLASGQHAALTAGAHISLSAGKSLFASVAERFSIFVHKLGIRMIAASGRVQIQAQSDGMQILAQQVLEVISTSDWINLKAKKGIRLQGAHSELVIGGEEDGIVGCTPGKFHMYSADPQLLGPKMVQPDMVDMSRQEICLPCLFDAMQAAKGVAYL